MRLFNRAILVLFVIALAPGCSPECGPVTSTRCEGVEAQICDADQRWQTFASCDEVGPGWTCAELPTGAACLPGGELDASSIDGGAL